MNTILQRVTPILQLQTQNRNRDNKARAINRSDI
jgi:hypothetical protein